MDSADKDTFQKAVSSHGMLLGEHHQLLQGLLETQQALGNQISQMGICLERLSGQLAPSPALPSPPPPQPLRESPVPPPEPYAGDLGRCKGFQLQCSLVFSRQPVTFTTDQAKVAYVTGLLRGRALNWAEAMLGGGGIDFFSYDCFMREMKKVFDHPVCIGDAAKRLLNLRQSQRSVADYSVEFRILAAEAGWNDEALKGAFLHGLCEQLKDELAVRDETNSLDALIDLSIRLDNRMRERRREKNYKSHTPVNAFAATPTLARVASGRSETHGSGPSSSTLSDEPMQVGRANLTPAERQRRIRAGECIYCGQVGHFLAACPLRPKERAHQ